MLCLGVDKPCGRGLVVIRGEELKMKRGIAVPAVTIALALFGGSITAASAEPTTDTVGCQTIAGKYLEEDAPGHGGVQNAAGQGPGEGPCGFGNPPRHQ